jgi:hypothetical protein
VERQDNTVLAHEIGRNEQVNNKGKHALINTAIAKAGWLFYQKVQWKALTDYLVAD